VDILLGDPTKAERLLGWKATCTLEQMTLEMVESDLAEARRLMHLRDGGFEVVEGRE
jgi:GDPmannose 4,6-dehydratase